MPKTAKKRVQYPWVYGFLLFAGLAALVASFTLTLDKFTILKNPNAILNCSFNAVLNCSRVMETWQSSLFGFPNMVIGLMAFPVVITLAVAFFSGVKFPRPFLVAAEICILAGTVFSYWLFFQSLYAIQILCPWCLVVTCTTTIMSACITYFNLYENSFNLKHPEAVQTWLKKGYYLMIVLAWLVLLAALVFLKFGKSLFV